MERFGNVSPSVDQGTYLTPTWESTAIHHGKERGKRYSSSINGYPDKLFTIADVNGYESCLDLFPSMTRPVYLYWQVVRQMHFCVERGRPQSFPHSN